MYKFLIFSNLESEKILSKQIMQPKCSLSSSNPSDSIALNMSLMHMPAERFKDFCLKINSDLLSCDLPKEISSVLDYLFNPLKELNLLKNDINFLKLYLTGGLSFETFKAKCS
jgi:hypothetical protein